MSYICSVNIIVSLYIVFVRCHLLSIVEHDKYGTSSLQGKLRTPFHRQPKLFFFSILVALLDRAQLVVFGAIISYFSGL